MVTRSRTRIQAAIDLQKVSWPNITLDTRQALESLIMDAMLALDEEGLNSYEVFDSIKQTYFTITGKEPPRPTLKDMMRK